MNDTSASAIKAKATYNVLPILGLQTRLAISEQ